MNGRRDRRDRQAGLARDLDGARQLTLDPRGIDVAATADVPLDAVEADLRRYLHGVLSDVHCRWRDAIPIDSRNGALGRGGTCPALDTASGLVARIRSASRREMGSVMVVWLAASRDITRSPAQARALP